MSELIRLQAVSKRYMRGDESVLALDTIDLIIQRNEYVAFVGASGSGKSTMMNLLGCLDTPSSGQYFLNGRDVAITGETELAAIRNREVGFVFQNFQLLSRATALENVMLPLVYRGLPLAKRRQRAAEALQQVGLANRMQHRPNELSGGQRQRVAIARALCAEPALLLADEPTGNLDSATSAEVMALFDELHAAGQTLVVVTHEPDIAAHCHRAIQLLDGRIASDIRYKAHHGQHG